MDGHPYTLQIKTFGKFELNVFSDNSCWQVELDHFDALLLTIVRSTLLSRVPLARLQSAMTLEGDPSQSFVALEGAIYRIQGKLSECSVQFNDCLKVVNSFVVLSSEVKCEADFARLSHQRDVIDSLPIKAVNEQLLLNQGEFLVDFPTCTWIQKKRLTYTKIFQNLLTRQMNLFALEGPEGKAEDVAHKLLQVSPFNLSALDVLYKFSVSQVGSNGSIAGKTSVEEEIIDVNFFGQSSVRYQKQGETKSIPISGYPRKLLATVLCSPDRRVSKEVLLDQLWPRATKQQARQRLHVALHELRQTFEKVRDGFSGLLRSDRVTVCVDPAVVGNIDIDLLKTSSRALAVLSIEQIDQILSATTNEFLQGERELQWITQMRRSCDQQVVKLMVRKAELLFGAGRLAEAGSVAEQAFEKLSSSEDACAILMNCHQALGNRERAIETFDRLRRVLRDEFDMKASDKISALANAIRKNEEGVTTQIPQVEMRTVLGEPSGASSIVSYSTMRYPQTSESFDSEDGIALTEAKSGVQRILLNRSLSTLWVWGLPGMGKKTLVKSVAFQLKQQELCRLHWVEFAAHTRESLAQAITERLNSSRAILKENQRNVVIVSALTSLQDAAALLEVIQNADSDAICVFISEDFPDAKSTVKVRAPGFETWSLRPGSIEVSPAVNAFCKFAQARGFSDLVDRSALSYLDMLCKYCGGVPGILEELAERLDFSPVNLLQGWLTLQTQGGHVEDANYTPTYTRQYCDYVRLKASSQFSATAHGVLCALCLVKSPISLYTLADILKVSRFETTSCIKNLVELGLVSTFRSKEFDLVFVSTSGLIADILNQVLVFDFDEMLLNSLVKHYGVMNFPKAEIPGKQGYRLAAEVLRFEYIWIETALDFALKMGMQQEVVKLSRILRRFYFDAGHVQAAANFFKRALVSSTDTNDLADFHAVLGGLYGRVGFGQLAVKHLLNALRYSRSINDEIREATALHSLGLCVGASGKYSRGVSFLNVACDLYTQNELENRYQVTLYSLAFLHVNDLRLDAARDILDGRRPSQLSIRSQSVATWQTVKAYLAYFSGDLPAASVHVTTGIKIAEEINFVQMSFKSQLCRALILIAEKKPIDAMKVLKSAVKQMQFHDYRSDAVHALSLLALSYVMLSEYHNALDALTKAEQLMEGVDDMQSFGMLAYARVIYVRVLKIPVDETWFRTQVLSRWRRFPTYIQLGFSSHTELMKELTRYSPLPPLNSQEDSRTTQVSGLFLSIQDVLEE